MQSTENPVMVSVQASLDHHVGDGLDPANPETPHIFTSAFYGALGIWPSRDNIQSGADSNAFEDILLANLMGGSFELGHRIGEANWDLLKVGLTGKATDWVLKPDRPIAPLDRCYFDGKRGGLHRIEHQR